MIEINWTLWLQFANFFILLALLNLLLYKPLRGMMENRKRSIEDSFGTANDLEKQIEEKVARYQEKLQEAKLKGSQEKAEIRKKAAEEETGILAEAREASAESLQAIQKKVMADVENSRRTLREESRELAGRIASKVLGREVA